MSAFLKRLFGGANKSSATVAPDSPPIVVGPIATIVDGPSLLRRKYDTKQTESAEQLRDWTCSKCGAPLPEVDAGKSLLKCASCGTLFHIQETPRVISDGVNITGSNITISGDVVGGDRIVIVTRNQSNKASGHITEC